MKKNEFMQIKGLDLKELGLKTENLREEIANLTLDKNMRKLKDVKMILKKKKELAQVLTLVKQKELLGKLEENVTKTEVAKTKEGGSKEVKSQKSKVKSSSKK